MCGTSMRTTSSLEANNCRLNDTVVNHGHFFTFLRDMRTEEFIKSKEFGRYILSGGKQIEPRDKYKVCLHELLCILILYFFCMIFLVHFRFFTFLVFKFFFSLFSASGKGN